VFLSTGLIALQEIIVGCTHCDKRLTRIFTMFAVTERRFGSVLVVDCYTFVPNIVYNF
jgi:hypothetical protein